MLSQGSTTLPSNKPPQDEEDKQSNSQRKSVSKSKSKSRRRQVTSRSRSKSKSKAKPRSTSKAVEKDRSGKLFKKFMRYNRSLKQNQYNQRIWRPIETTLDIPESFYMKEAFNSVKKSTKYKVYFRKQDHLMLKNIKQKHHSIVFDSFMMNMSTSQLLIKLTQKLNRSISLKKKKNQFTQRFETDLIRYLEGRQTGIPRNISWRMNKYELDGFLASILFQGLLRLSSIQEYWGEKKIRKRKPDKITRLQKYNNNRIYQPDYQDDELITSKLGSIISRCKWLQIRTNIHLADNLNVKGKEDPLYKVRAFVDLLNEKFKRYYSPGEYLTIDEGIIPFQGRVRFKVYAPDKPCKWGIKEYVLCDAQSTYTLELRVYYGQTRTQVTVTNGVKEEKVVLVDNEETELKTTELVQSLLKQYAGRKQVKVYYYSISHKVVMDNYYTSPKLLSLLKEWKIGALGTIRHNRIGLLREQYLDDHFQQIYENRYACYIHGDDCVLVYFLGSADKEIALISSFVDNTLMCDHEWDIRKNHYKDVSEKKEPYISHLYNKFKCGVDRRNLSVIKYRTKFRNVKWWRTIFDRMFETAVLNAFIIYRSYYPEKCKDGAHKEFRQMLMYELSESYNRFKKSMEPPKGITQMMMVQKMMLDKDRQPPIFVEREKWVKKKHTILICGLSNCEECGRATRYMCQECSWLLESQGLQRSIGVCSDFCMKLHRYGPLLAPGMLDIYRSQLRNRVQDFNERGYSKPPQEQNELEVNEDPQPSMDKFVKKETSTIVDKLEDNDEANFEKDDKEEIADQPEYNNGDDDFDNNPSQNRYNQQSSQQMSQERFNSFQEQHFASPHFQPSHILQQSSSQQQPQFSSTQILPTLSQQQTFTPIYQSQQLLLQQQQSQQQTNSQQSQQQSTSLQQLHPQDNDYSVDKLTDTLERLVTMKEQYDKLLELKQRLEIKEALEQQYSRMKRNGENRRRNSDDDDDDDLDDDDDDQYQQEQDDKIREEKSKQYESRNYDQNRHQKYKKSDRDKDRHREVPEESKEKGSMKGNDSESRPKKITEMTISDLIQSLKQKKDGTGVITEAKEVVDMLSQIINENEQQQIRNRPVPSPVCDVNRLLEQVRDFEKKSRKNTALRKIEELTKNEYNQHQQKMELDFDENYAVSD